MKQRGIKIKGKITKIDVTTDTLTGRGGMALFVCYLSGIKIYGLFLAGLYEYIYPSFNPFLNTFQKVDPPRA